MSIIGFSILPRNENEKKCSNRFHIMLQICTGFVEPPRSGIEMLLVSSGFMNGTDGML